VHPGIDLARFGFVAPPAERHELLVLGAITPWKRPELALEIAALAARRLPGLRLTLAGAPLDGEGERLLASLRERAGRPDLDGRVRFAGGLEDPRPALAASSCLLHCAEREPFGMALAEALATGRPVVAPAAGGPLEVVSEDCGRLYRPGVAHEAAEAVVELLESEPAALAAAARVRAERCFELGEARRRYRELLSRA
jgi:glycosyltransferase involved in cell wall biosynthesis